VSYAIEQGNGSCALVSASLQAREAKVWIDECDETQTGNLDPAILYEPWLESLEQEEGVPAPIGTKLEVKGGWLDDQGVEQLNPVKANRSMEIHTYGFS